MRFVVRQPNGLFAIWSSVVDDFVMCNLTEREAFRECLRDQGVLEARLTVLLALEDLDPYTPGKPFAGSGNDGLDRWRHCIATISAVHGPEVGRERQTVICKRQEGACN